MKQISKKSLLINRLSRLIGQLESIKTSLEQEDTNCIKTSQMVKATARSFSSFRRAFLECFLEDKYLPADGSRERDKNFQALLEVINS